MSDPSQYVSEPTSTTDEFGEPWFEEMARERDQWKATAEGRLAVYEAADAERIAAEAESAALRERAERAERALGDIWAAIDKVAPTHRAAIITALRESNDG